VTRNHTLLEPRVLAAVGILGLGGSIGLSLLLAVQFALVGLLLSLASVAGVMWIYSGEFREVYSALIGRRAYAGAANIIEILLIFTLAIVITTLSLSLYFSPPTTNNPSIRSRLEFDSVEPVKYPNRTYTVFNAQIKNEGPLTASESIISTGGLISKRLLSPDEERAAMNKLISDIQQVPKIKRQGEIQPTQLSILTIPDINTRSNAALEADDSQIAEISSGKLMLYVFVVSEYSDEGRNNANWRLEFCGYFLTTYAYWHNCAWPSRVSRLPPS
jgi:hypothetical protein